MSLKKIYMYIYIFFFFKVRHVFQKRRTICNLFILSFRHVQREFGADRHLVERGGLFLSVWYPALGNIVERWLSAVSGPNENEPLVEDEGAVLRRRVGNSSPNGTASRSRRYEL